MEGPGGKSEGLGLVDERSDYLRVTVTLVDGRVRREEVKILLSVDAVELGADPLAEDDGEGVVVVRAVLVLEGDAIFALRVWCNNRVSRRAVPIADLGF